jgi:hypothetical protein
MSNPALWGIYGNARYQEMLEEANKSRRARAFQETTSKPKRFGRIKRDFGFKPRFRPTMAK